MRAIKPLLLALALPVVIIAAGAGVYIYSGAYDVAASASHNAGVDWLLETTRERSIHVRSEDVAVPPDLVTEERVLAGAAHYDTMCAPCHLRPGLDDTELRRGLNPRPPNFSRRGEDPGEAFWVIKYGIRMTGMPAWGETHDDEEIWSIVALLQRLHELTPDEYAALLATAEGHHHDGGGHSQETTLMDEEPAAEEAQDHEHDHGEHGH